VRAGIIVRAQRAVAVSCRPLKLDVRSPMASAQTELRATAVFYALLGTLSVGLGLIILRWTWSGLWEPTLDHYSSEARIAASVGIFLWLLAALSLRYRSLSRIWQFPTFGGSLFLSLWTLGTAVLQTLHPVEIVIAPAWVLIATKWLLASAFLLCSCVLWKHRASNNRWSGRES
jgi:hypothetical protein